MTKKRTTGTYSNRASFFYQSSRERMDEIEAAAKKHGIQPNAMLDRMVDDWLKGTLPAKVPDDDTPWYMK